ncbi:hypothetical protein ABKV19_004972 [Rosa sericea]
MIKIAIAVLLVVVKNLVYDLPNQLKMSSVAALKLVARNECLKKIPLSFQIRDLDFLLCLTKEGLMKEMQRSKEGLMKKMQRKKTEVSKLGKLKCRDEHDSVQDVKADDLRQMLLAMTEEELAVAILRHFRYPCSVHLAPGSKFNFQKYIKRSLEDDFKMVSTMKKSIFDEQTNKA